MSFCVTVCSRVLAVKILGKMWMSNVCYIFRWPHCSLHRDDIFISEIKISYLFTFNSKVIDVSGIHFKISFQFVSR